MTNRVDELESEIAELRAAVNGLTEELVETKARVRELESDAEAEADAGEDGFVEADPVDANETTKSDDHVEVVEQESTEPVEDIASTESEADNTTEQQESTDDEAAESSDIIVA